MSEFTPQPSCADPSEPNSLTVGQARAHIAELVKPLASWQKRALRDALDHTLHADIVSPIQVPAYNNSAMDGYAIKGSDISTTPVTLELVGHAYAGHPYLGSVKPGQCVRIMTGAMMPPDCDTVIMQEHVEANAQSITIHGTHKVGQNVRLAGEDLQTGQTVLTKGHHITPADLGLIASLGIAEVTTTRKVRVAFFSTGDELRSLGETLEPGQIFDSNRYTLFGMLTKLQVELIDMGVIPDNKEALRAAFELASSQADVVITSGGVSVGDADYVKEILDELGEINFWKIAMKPGRPLAFGQVGNALFFGLPGNPVSVMVTFYQFVRPALLALSGQTDIHPHYLRVNCVSPIKKRPGRFEFQRGILFQNEQGELEVKTTGEQGSGILHSMSIANCFILLDEACDGIMPNTTVTVQPFSGLI